MDSSDLPSLDELSTKYIRVDPNQLDVGDVVIIKNRNKPDLSWIKIIANYGESGEDGKGTNKNMIEYAFKNSSTMVSKNIIKKYCETSENNLCIEFYKKNNMLLPSPPSGLIPPPPPRGGNKKSKLAKTQKKRKLRKSKKSKKSKQ